MGQRVADDDGPVERSSGEPNSTLPDDWKSASIRVASFDVFDTLVLRCVPMPTDAFSLVGSHLRDRELIPEWIDPHRFAQMRWAAERAARRSRSALWGDTEVSIEEIYRVLHEPLQGVALEACVEAELKVEEQLVVPDDALIALLVACSTNGLQTVLVSDTYFSSGQVARLLRGAVPPEIAAVTRIFTSSDARCGKSDGLFVKVLADLRISPEEMVHIGDDALSDVAAARRHGIKAVGLERTPEWLRRISAREGSGALQDPEAAPVARGRTPGESADLGLTALRRLATSTTEMADSQPSMAMLSSVLGPALSAFAGWVVESAASEGFSRMNCLMREGTLLEPLVSRESAAQDAGLATSRLWLSRLVCIRAAIQTCSYDELLPLIQRRRPITLGEMIRELCGCDVPTPFVARNADRLLVDGAFVHEVIEEIAEIAEIVDTAQSRAEKLRRVLVDHLEPHREPDGTLVLVDLGWGCTSQLFVQRALAYAGCPTRTVGFYVATTDVASHRALEGLEVHSFLGLEHAQALARSPEPLEQLGVSDEGSLVDLRPDGPVHAPNQIPSGQQCQAASLREAILKFQALWHRARAANPTLARLATDGRGVVGHALVKMLESPTPEEAQFFGSWVHDDNLGSIADADPLVGQLTQQEASYASPSQLGSLPHRIIPWPGATVAEARPQRPVLRTFLRVKDRDRWRTSAQQAEPGSSGKTLAVLASDVDELDEIAVHLTDVPAIVRIDRVRIVCEHEQRTSEVVFESHDLREIMAEGLAPIAGFRKLFTAQGDAPHLRWPPSRRLRHDADDHIRHVLVVVGYWLLPAPDGIKESVPARRRLRRRRTLRTSR